MPEKYAILSGSNKAVIGHITILDNTGVIELNPQADEGDIPFEFRRSFRNGEYSIDRERVFKWIITRIPPQYRQDIGDVLRELGLSEYNEIEMFKAYRGRSVRDDYYIEMVEDE